MGPWEAARVRLDNEDGDLMMGLVPSKKGKVSVGLSKPGSWVSPDIRSVGVSVSDFSTSRTMRNESPLFVSHPVYGFFFFLMAAQTD